MAALTQSGRWEVILLLAFCVGVFLWKAGKRNYLWGAVIIVLGGEFIVRFLKIIIARPRPDLISHLTEVNGFSFPSGHAFMAVSFYGFLAYLVFRGNYKRKNGMVMFLVSLISLIGFSRVYLGVHWPTDILGSFILGAIWIKIVMCIIWKLDNKFKLL